MGQHRDTPWAPYVDLFDEAVAFAEYSLANEDIGFLAMNRRRTMVEVFGLLGEEINEATGEGRGVDPFIVRYYVQQIIDRASFPDDDQPPLHYDDMPDPPDDPDLRVFTWQPRPSNRPRRESHDHDIAWVVGEVVGRFGLNTHASVDRKPGAPPRRPSAVEVVAEALRRSTDRRRGSVSSVRACLTPETAEYYEEGLKEGRAQKATSEGGSSDPG